MVPLKLQINGWNFSRVKAQFKFWGGFFFPTVTTIFINISLFFTFEYLFENCYFYGIFGYFNARGPITVFHTIIKW